MNSGRIEMIKTTAQRSIYQIKVEGCAVDDEDISSDIIILGREIRCCRMVLKSSEEPLSPAHLCIRRV
jgi:hypothetical protein